MPVERTPVRTTAKSLLRPTTPKDAPQLISFLASFLQNETSRPDLLHWKLWAPREDYAEPRSYVLERNGKIMAHAGIWPMVLRTSGGTVRGCHLFDWAADPRALGAGVALVQRIYKMFDFLYAIGGSEMTQKIIPAIGFEQVGESWSAARPLRPLRQVLSHQYMNWRIPARLVRNTVWSIIPMKTAPEGWTMEEGFGESQSPSLPLQAAHCTARSDGFFRYLQSCPAAQIRIFDIQKDGRSVGRTALSFLYNQVRIVGVWLSRPSDESMCAAYRMAQQVARAIDAAFEIVSSGSTPTSESAAVSAGMRVRKRTPIYTLCAKGNPLPASFEFQIADTDAVFQSVGGPSYWT